MSDKLKELSEAGRERSLRPGDKLTRDFRAEGESEQHCCTEINCIWINKTRLICCQQRTSALSACRCDVKKMCMILRSFTKKAVNHVNNLAKTAVHCSNSYW
jgi:hypothetical protein